MRATQIRWFKRVCLLLVPVSLFGIAWHQASWRPQTLTQQAVWSLEYSPNGRWLAAGNMESTTGIWDTQTKRQLLNLAGGGVFSPDDMIAVTDWHRIAALWDLQIAKPVRNAQGQVAQAKARLWNAQRVKLTRSIVPGQPGQYFVAHWLDGRMLACGRGAGETLQLWDASTGHLLQTLKGHDGPAQPIAFSRDATTVASYGYDRTSGRVYPVVRVWDVHSGKLLRQVQAWPGRYGLCIALSPDGRTLAVGTSDGNITFWPIK